MGTLLILLLNVLRENSIRDWIYDKNAFYRNKY